MLFCNLQLYLISKAHVKLKSKGFFKSLLANETVAGINKKFGSAHENGPWSYTVGTMHVRNIY